MNLRPLLFLPILTFALNAGEADPGVAPPPSSKEAAIASARTELEAMLVTDQQYRKEAIEIERTYGREAPHLRQVWQRQKQVDTDNITNLEQIIARFGWPGRTQFGDKAALAAFLVLQHSALWYQKKYLPIAREAAANGEMRGSSLALLEDRVRLREGGKQIYGSQVQRNAADEWEPLPLEDEANVDARRKRVGLGPLSEYLGGFAKDRGGWVSPKWLKQDERRGDQPADRTAAGVTPAAAPEQRH